MSKVIGGITKALVIEPDGKGKARSGRKPSGEPIFDRAKVKHKDIRQHNSTDLLYNILSVVDVPVCIIIGHGNLITSTWTYK